LIRRPKEEWIQADRRHQAVIPDDWFARTEAAMASRRTCKSSPRRRPARRFYLLRGVVQCATGHNPLRMQGKIRKGNTYYACGYRIAYGDNAAEALGHGKWQYIREDRLTDCIDQFYIFGPNAVAHFRSQHAALAPTLNDKATEQRERTVRGLADLDQRIARQIAAIEAGVDPVLVGERIRALKAERQQTETTLATLDLERRQRATLDLDDACAVLGALPDLSKPLAKADPELLRCARYTKRSTSPSSLTETRPRFEPATFGL
jgi:hypothetical protein